MSQVLFDLKRCFYALDDAKEFVCSVFQEFGDVRLIFLPLIIQACVFDIWKLCLSELSVLKNVTEWINFAENMLIGNMYICRKFKLMVLSLSERVGDLFYHVYKMHFKQTNKSHVVLTLSFIKCQQCQHFIGDDNFTSGVLMVVI